VGVPPPKGESTWTQLLPLRTSDFMKIAKERQVSLKKTQSLSMRMGSS
jgi:hypothetical protein